MKKLLILIGVLLLAACLAPVGAQTPVRDAVCNFDWAVRAVEEAYAGFFDKTAGREEEYAALKERLQKEIASGRGADDAVAEYLGWFDDSHLGSEGTRAYRPKSLRRSSDYAARMTCYAPKFVHCRVDGETYLIRFPSCDLDSAQRAAVRAAVNAYRASGCDNLIVDIRGNSGGNDSSYAPLLELLYDHEGVGDAAAYRASELSIAYVGEFSGHTERGRARIARLQHARAGSFLEDEHKTYAIRLDSVAPLPRRAALMLDGKVASSGEQLVLDLRACSSRTTIYGQDNTMGCLDYSNCALVCFPPDTIPKMQVPVTRSWRVAEGRGIDADGIAPDVRITLPLPATLTDNVDEWVRWVALDMKTKN